MTSEDNSKDEHLNYQNDEEELSKNTSQQQEQPKSEKKLAEKTKPSAHSAWFQAKDENVRLNLPTDEPEYEDTTSQDTDDYVETSGLTEPYSVEPQEEDMKDEKVYEETSKSSQPDTASFLAKAEKVRLKLPSDEPEYEETSSVDTSDYFETDEHVESQKEERTEKNEKKTEAEKEKKYYQPHSAGKTKPIPKIQTVRQRKKDVEGPRGPTEGLGTESGLQESTIKQARLSADKEGVGLTEPLNVEPTAQSEEAKRQKIYDVGIVHKEKKIEAKKEGKNQTAPKLKVKIIVGKPRKEDVEGLRGPTEPMATEPRIQQSTIKQARVFAGKEGVGLTEPQNVEPTVQSEEAKRQKVYDVVVLYEEKEVEADKDTLSSSIGPTEDVDFEPESQAEAIKQVRMHEVSRVAGEDAGPTEPYSVEAETQDTRFKEKPKLSDRMEYLARPKKDALDRFGYKRPEGTVPEYSLPSWSILPLSTKLPAGEYPYRITMTTLSKELYLLPPGEDMNLHDEYNLQKPHYAYSSLCDPCLKSHFKRKGMSDHLEKQGFASEAGNLICSLKDINDYRMYCRRVLAAKSLQIYHEEDLEEKRKREEHYKKQRELLEEKERKKNVRTQVQMRTYLKNAIATIKEGSMTNERERERKILNAQLRNKYYYAQRTANNKHRSKKIYDNHLKEKYEYDIKRKQLKKELIETEKDKQEKFRIKQELKKLEKKKQNEEFWERKAAAQFEWLKEGYRLDSKFNKKLQAHIEFRKENLRSPSRLSLSDVQDIKNKIYRLSKEEEEAEQELSAKEDQSHSEYKSRDIQETNRLSIGESTDEVAERKNKSK